MYRRTLRTLRTLDTLSPFFSTSLYLFVIHYTYIIYTVLMAPLLLPASAAIHFLLPLTRPLLDLSSIRT